MEFWVFILVVAVVILIGCLYQLDKELKKSQKELKQLHLEMADLENKSRFIYKILKDMGAVPGFPKNQSNRPAENAPEKTEQKADSAAAVPLTASQTADKAKLPDTASGVTLAKKTQEAPESTVSAAVITAENGANVNADSKVSSALKANMPPVTDNKLGAAQNNAAADSDIYKTIRNNIPPAVNNNLGAAPAANTPYGSVRPAAPAANATYITDVNPSAPAANTPYSAGVNVGINNKGGSRIGSGDTPQQQQRHIEEWLGTRLFNIAASLLIFIGLILFCTLSTEQVTNTMKMIAMFVVSGGFIAAGTFFSRKDKSVFPLGMLGCGFGTFFISILLSHIYFHSLGDIAAFSLILVWSAFALFMSKKLDSVMLSVTAHIGTAVSICFAFTLGFTAERVVLLTIYQLAAIAVIIGGNIFCCRKTYRFGLIMSQCLLVYTSIAMSHAFSEKFIMPQSVSAAAAAAVYAVQFAAICFVSYLVATSAAALEKEGLKKITITEQDENDLTGAFERKANGERLISISTVVHAVNKLLWTSGTVASVGCITYYICKNAIKCDTVIPTAVALIIAALLHLTLTLFMEEKLNFSTRLASVSIWFISAVIIVSLFAAAHDYGMPFVFIYSLLLIAIFKLTKNKGLAPVTSAALFIEAVYMTFYGYFAIENVWISIPYMFVLGGVLLLLWAVQDGKHKQRYFKYMKIAEYIWISFSIISINASEFSDISFPLIMSEFALMNIICYFIKFGSENEPELRTVVKAESLLTVYIGMITFTFELAGGLGDNNIIKAVMVVMIAAITAVYIYDFARSNSSILQIISALTTAGFVTFLCIGFSDYFKPFEIYTDALYCRPFIFIFAAAMLIIYVVKKNHHLILPVWIGITLDMVSMVLAGYDDLIYYAAQGTGNTLPAHLLATGFSLAHAAIMLAATFVMNDMTIRNVNSTRLMRELPRYISLIWVNAAFPVITYDAFYETKLENISIVFAMIVLTLINTAVFAMKYQDEPGTPFNLTVRGISAVAFYAALPCMSFGKTGSRIEYVACVVLMLSCAALFFVKSREILKSKLSLWVQLYIGINSTIFINCAANGLSSSYDFAYVFSIVTMITALLCITAGFIAKAKGLRIYGLIVVMICIIKLVTIDISGADSLARVLAFIIGGVICFIISGIYNRVEKSLLRNDAAPVMQPVMETVSVPAGGQTEVISSAAETVSASIQNATDPKLSESKETFTETSEEKEETNTVSENNDQ